MLKAICLLIAFLSLCQYSAWGFRPLSPVRPRFSPSLRTLQAITNLLTPEEFEKATKDVNNKMPSVIDFQKSKCKPCIRIAPEFEALSEKYQGTANFYKVDADSSSEALALMKANGIRSVPTFQIWKGGEMLDSIQGAHLDEVEEALVRAGPAGP